MSTPTKAAPTGTEAKPEQAAGIVTELAERLVDPREVATAACAADNVDLLPGMPAAQSPWGTLGLGEAHAGVALLYAELSHTDERFRTATHAHLAAAARGLGDPAVPGLFGGAASLAFAANAARHSEDDYAGMLATLDARVAAQVNRLLTGEGQRLAAGRAGVQMRTYDIVAGVTGLGRYLLLRGERHREQLTDTLAYLVRLTEPVEAHGHRVPGWWVPLEPGHGPQFPRGHFNLGLAHGISGPLALLSLAWQAGVRVPGQREAIIQIAEHLLDHRTEQGMWPGVMSFDAYVGAADPHSGHTRMIAWCYGTPGTARALQLAAIALDHPDWQRQAVDAQATALETLLDTVTDSSLCHGWAGLLHLTGLMAQDGDDPRLHARRPELAARLLAAYHPDHPFGYHYERPQLSAGLRQAPHRAGFLDGSAGIALALHAYANASCASPWQTALLVA
ncbi:lanthionine synthetase C family protein [Streptomyces yunnanensis]|uniref:Lanthionine synthetase C-like protein n=1 Tax=Streptomyces yunnanensis TaxID=156453 RepID=A0A9X8MU99_9ACTN|nr:lanthionine synthetase C family protein [Streptomyces yunnanensis]SHL84411.1 Lanthionine synthetase C-like protein [Streptomyces yunnanensis]